MKKVITAVAVSLFCLQSFAQSANPKHDEALATSLGADDYGMKMYVLAILKSGSNKIADKKTTDSLFQGHMANIERLAQEGKLVVAGPLKKNEREYRGIFIFNVKTIEEANALVETDPAIKGKLFDVELFQWYGSAALPLYLDSHEKIEKKKM